MNVSLTPELEKLITEKVRSGRYASSSEVVREALRLLEKRDELEELRGLENPSRVQGTTRPARRGGSRRRAAG